MSIRPLIAMFLLGTSAAFAQFRTVTVANSSTQPVPVQAQGTTTVSGSVTATISGTPNVAISGTPAVTVTGTPNVAISGTPSVTVSNTTLAPVPIAGTGNISAAPIITRNNDEPARHAYSRVLNAPFSGSGVTITAGAPTTTQELVIEDVSAIATTTSGQIDYFYAQFFFTGATDFLSATLTPSGAVITHQATRLYIDPNHTYTLAVVCNTSCAGNVTFSVSGYLVNVP